MTPEEHTRRLAEWARAKAAFTDAQFRRERRERIAVAAMQGLAADPTARSGANAAELAVKWADCLIAELDKEDSNVS